MIDPDETSAEDHAGHRRHLQRQRRRPDRAGTEQRREHQLHVDEQEEHERAGERGADDVAEDAAGKLEDVFGADGDERMRDAGGHRHRRDEQAEEREQREQPRRAPARAR